MKDNYGLLIASIVAIVAIVGLVILFAGGKSGALVLEGERSTSYGFTEIMRPCEFQSVGTSCATPFGQPGYCKAIGKISGLADVCNVNVGCYCEFQN